MSEPAKDEAELIAQITDTLSSDGRAGFTFSHAVASRCFYYEQAIRAIAAIRAAGWAVVPVEPTKEMFDAARASSAHGHGIVDLYRAMIEAALGVKP